MRIKTKEDLRRLYRELKDKRVVLTLHEFSEAIGYHKNYVPKLLNSSAELSEEFLKAANKGSWSNYIDQALSLKADHVQNLEKETGPEEPEPDYKAKYFALKAVVVELLRGNVSSSDVLEKLEADPALPGQSPAAFDDSAAGIERTYKGKKES
jgi:hypothetical protein